MNLFHNIAHSLDEDMYCEFKIALLEGQWRNGDTLTDNQRKVCEEVVSIREAYKFQQPETQYILQQEPDALHNIFTIDVLQ